MNTTDHQCKRTKESGKVFASYYDDKQGKKVFYCHYCGENVSDAEYIETLEQRFKSLQERADRFEAILRQIPAKELKMYEDKVKLNEAWRNDG